MPGELSITTHWNCDSCSVRRSELHAVEPIYVCAVFGNTLDACKKDCWFLGKEILDKDFAECHRDWADFFPKFRPHNPADRATPRSRGN